MTINVDRSAGYVRDKLVTGGILSVAAAAWFMWGRAGGQLRTLLLIGAVLAGVVAVIAIVQTIRAGGPTTMATDPAARKTYNLWVLFEVVAIVGGALVLAAVDSSEYLPAWVLLVVGVHWIPMAKPFGMPWLLVSAVVTIGVALVAIGAGLTDLAPVATIAGGVGGVVLLASALSALAAARADG